MVVLFPLTIKNFPSGRWIACPPPCTVPEAKLGPAVKVIVTGSRIFVVAVDPPLTTKYLPSGRWMEKVPIPLLPDARIGPPVNTPLAKSRLLVDEYGSVNPSFPVISPETTGPDVAFDVSVVEALFVPKSVFVT